MYIMGQTIEQEQFEPFVYEATLDDLRRWMGGDPRETQLVTVRPDGVYTRDGRGDKIAGPATAASLAEANGRLNMERWVK